MQVVSLGHQSSGYICGSCWFLIQENPFADSLLVVSCWFDWGQNLCSSTRNMEAADYNFLKENPFCRLVFPKILHITPVLSDLKKHDQNPRWKIYSINFRYIYIFIVRIYALYSQPQSHFSVLRLYIIQTFWYCILLLSSQKQASKGETEMYIVETQDNEVHFFFLWSTENRRFHTFTK